MNTDGDVKLWISFCVAHLLVACEDVNVIISAIILFAIMLLELLSQNPGRGFVVRSYVQTTRLGYKRVMKFCALERFWQVEKLRYV